MLLGNSLELVYAAPWTVMLPGAAITLSVLIVNLLGTAFAAPCSLKPNSDGTTPWHYWKFVI